MKRNGMEKRTTKIKVKKKYKKKKTIVRNKIREKKRTIKLQQGKFTFRKTKNTTRERKNEKDDRSLRKVKQKRDE